MCVCGVCVWSTGLGHLRFRVLLRLALFSLSQLQKPVFKTFGEGVWAFLARFKSMFLLAYVFFSASRQWRAIRIFVFLAWKSKVHPHSDIPKIPAQRCTPENLRKIWSCKRSTARAYKTRNFTLLLVSLLLLNSEHFLSYSGNVRQYRRQIRNARSLSTPEFYTSRDWTTMPIKGTRINLYRLYQLTCASTR